MLAPILLFTTLNGLCYARFTSFDDAATLISTSIITTIAEDGSSVVLSEIKSKILKEQGRATYTNFHFNYNAGRSEVEIIEAKTIFNGSEYHVPKENIEFKPLASSPHGFDQQMQVLIAFPNVEVGAEIYIKDVEKFKSIFDGYFSTGMLLNSPLQSFSSKFISKIPLHIKVNDPENVLDIATGKSNFFHELDISLKKPVYRSFIGKSENGGIINEEKLIVVSLSSEKNWNTLSDRIVPHYEKVLSQKLPTIFEEIAKQAAKFQNDIDVINAVTSLLSEKIQYMGDWRSISGGWLPRDLEQIASSTIGDCKDMSSSAGAILRSLGFKVNSALVARGSDIHPNYIRLPSLGAFNHVFLKVTAKDGSVYWIEPTHDISMAQTPFEDTAGKIALVLDTQSPSYERVSYIDYDNSVSFTEKNITLLSESRALYDIELSLQGASASRYTATALYSSNDVIKDGLTTRFSRKSLNKNDIKYVELPDLKSRIVQDLLFKFSFNTTNAFYKTNFGLGMNLEYLYDLEELFKNSEERVTDILMTPGTTIQKTLLKGIVVPNTEALNFNASNDWFDLSRNISHSSNGTEVLTKLVMKHTIIPSEFIATEEFQELRNDYLENFSDSFILVEPQIHLDQCSMVDQCGIAL